MSECTDTMDSNEIDEGIAEGTPTPISRTEPGSIVGVPFFYFQTPN